MAIRTYRRMSIFAIDSIGVADGASVDDGLVGDDNMYHHDS